MAFSVRRRNFAFSFYHNNIVNESFSASIVQSEHHMWSGQFFEFKVLASHSNHIEVIYALMNKLDPSEYCVVIGLNAVHYFANHDHFDMDSLTLGVSKKLYGVELLPSAFTFLFLFCRFYF